MVFTITRANIENNGPLFLRDVLRHNLTDPIASTRTKSQWVFKGMLKNTDIEPPIIVMDKSSISDKVIGKLRGTRVTTYRLGLMVWAKEMEDRDNLANEIKEVLQDDSNTDGTNTILSQGLTHESTESNVNDGMVKGYSEQLRIKELDITFKFMK